MPPRPQPRVAISAGLALASLPGALLAQGQVTPPPPAAEQPASPDTVPQFVLLAVTLNGQPQPEPVLFLQGPGDSLSAPAEAFKAWRLALPAAAPVEAEGTAYYPLRALPGIVVRFSTADQSVTIDARPESFAGQVFSIDSNEVIPMSPSGTGAFLGYDLFGEGAGGAYSLAGGFDGALFTRRGVLTGGFVAALGGGNDRLVRLDTTFLVDRPGRLTSLRVGDTLSSSAAGTAPVRIAGIQYARNFAVRPGFVTAPLPIARGSAAVPSVVDVYVNDALSTSREVVPGPFTLTNIPVNAGGGTFQVVVRDLLGRETLFTQSFYASSLLLRRGLHDFSYEAGLTRTRFGERSFSYGEPLASTTHRYGFTDWLTGEGTVQFSPSAQVAGGGVTVLPFGLGLVTAATAASRSDRGTGARATLGFERAARDFSFGARGEITTADFAYAGLEDDDRDERLRLPRHTLQAFADVPVRGGSLGVNIVHRDRRGERDDGIAGVSGQIQVGGLGSLNLYARQGFAGTRETVAGLSFSMSLGRQNSLSVGAEQGRRGFGGFASIQKNAPLGPGDGYRLSTSLGESRVSEASYVRNLDVASIGARVARAGDSTGVRLSALGGLGVIDGDLFASRDIGDAFARVVVPGLPGVRVYADNQLVGVTGPDGALLVPSLRPFETNRLRVDDTDLPLDARVGATEVLVRPYARAGTPVRFDIARERGVLLEVRLEDGTPLPAGARLVRDGMDEELIAVPGGEVYVPDLTGTARFAATWEGGRCAFTVDPPAGDDPQPRLTGLVCRRLSDAP